jgi:hypothetical protein
MNMAQQPMMKRGRGRPPKNPNMMDMKNGSGGGEAYSGNYKDNNKEF